MCLANEEAACGVAGARASPPIGLACVNSDGALVEGLGKLLENFNFKKGFQGFDGFLRVEASVEG